MNRPFFSIIVAIYNAEPYLVEALDAVFGQTCRDFELIAVDDGSHDRSVAIVKEFQKRYGKQISLIESHHQGSLVARAIGMEKAKGDYILCIDADDKMRSDYLEGVFQRIRKTGADLVLTNYSTEADFSRKKRPCFFPTDELLDSQEVLDTFFRRGQLMTLWSKVFHRSLCPPADFYKNLPDIRTGTDAVVSAYVIEHAQKPLSIDKAYYFYRQVPNSLSNTLDTNFFDSKVVLEFYFQEKYKELGDVVKSSMARRVNWFSTLYLSAADGYLDFLKRLKHVRSSAVFQESLAYLNFEEVTPEQRRWFTVHRYPILAPVAYVTPYLSRIWKRLF
ncbi:glycosyltransferase family 2 protein [Streptococcus suis]|uniref:glycosyltransferase family 2 protein n=1 Tax=Streptococcus suis TaxID=1307 RepID=UPI001924D767|nr:glycosyltransferase family 2 protein [Streptococcus suis]MBL1125238.1 glycosyltransferase family 2 protein [Streptococcus suis]